MEIRRLNLVERTHPPAPSLPPTRHEVVPLGKGPFGEADRWKEKGGVMQDCGMRNGDCGLLDLVENS